MSITGKVVDMELIDVDAFEALVADALATIPDELRVEMENVAIIIDDESPPGSLYGLYEGIPLTSRGRYTG
jgi:predicted Zn-dependent protease with MMP-like domain